MKINIFDYQDYRKFIKDRFNYLKKDNPRYSYRAFSKKSGVKSSSFLPHIIDGSKNLGEKGILSVIKGFDLTVREAKYFRNLVYFNQTENHDQKNKYWKKIISYQQKSKELMEFQYEILSNWYYVAILELLKIDSVRLKDIEFIQNHLLCKISISKIKNAVNLLMKVGLVEKDNDEGYLVKEKMISTPDEFLSTGVCNFHQSVSHLAANSLLKIHYSKREFSSLTINTNQQGIEKVKEEIVNFRKKLNQILEEEIEGRKNRTVQINLQIFPLSKEVKSD